MEHEAAYTDFLKSKKVKLMFFNGLEVLSEEDRLAFYFKLKHDVLPTDRDLIDKAQSGFVSFVRYYREHQLAYIFPFN